MLLRLARLLRHPSSTRRPIVLQRPLRFESLEAREVLNATWAGPLAEGEPVAFGGNPQPNFELQDVNPNSSASGTALSPSDYRNQVSAWYFTYFT